MKSIKISVAAVCLAVVMMFASCGTKTGTGLLIGTAGGGALGAAVGALIGGSKGAAAGAAIGGAAGAATGAIIGHQMDKKAKELANIEGANVNLVEVDGLKAIQVTFDGGILFDTGKSALKDNAKTSLDKFAATMKDTPAADFVVWGHTDNTGSLATNQKLSLARAQAVADYLKKDGIAAAHLIKVEGKDSQLPIADNATVEGRAQNRRVEIYIIASEEMIKAAQAQAEAKK